MEKRRGRGGRRERRRHNRGAGGSWFMATGVFLFPPGFPSYVFRFLPNLSLFLPLIFVFCCPVWSTSNYSSHEKDGFVS